MLSQEIKDIMNKDFSELTISDIHKICDNYENCEGCPFNDNSDVQSGCDLMNCVYRSFYNDIYCIDGSKHNSPRQSWIDYGNKVMHYYLMQNTEN